MTPPPDSDESVESTGAEEQGDLARAAAALRAVQERTVARAERLVERLSVRPPALGE